MPRSAYVCVLPTVLPALAWPPTAPRRSGELIMHGTAMLYLHAACTGRHVLCALHTLVEQRRGPARLAQLSWPSRGAPGYLAPLHGVSGLWVNLVVLLHALHARQPLHGLRLRLWSLPGAHSSFTLPPSRIPPLTGNASGGGGGDPLSHTSASGGAASAPRATDAAAATRARGIPARSGSRHGMSRLGSHTDMCPASVPEASNEGVISTGALKAAGAALAGRGEEVYVARDKACTSHVTQGHTTRPQAMAPRCARHG
jgi:hypothetical protein